MQVVKSETLSLSQNDTRSIQTSFLQSRGPRGGRNVVNRLVLKHSVQVDTNGSTTIAAGGWAQFLKRLRIWDAQGDLINLTGPEIRALHIYTCGRDANPDPTALAISQSNATRTVYLQIDFAPSRRTRRRWDYALPVDSIKGIEVVSASATDIGTGGGTTIDSHSLTMYVHTREEFDVESHSRRELRSLSQSNLQDLQLPAMGGLIRNAFLFKYADHVTGGAAQDATAVTIEAFGMSRIEPDILQKLFVQEGSVDQASTSDPFVQSSLRAIPLVWSQADGKLNDYFRHPSNVLVRLEGSTVSNNVMVFELITKRTELSSEADRELAAASGLEVATIKTQAKTRRAPEAWGPLASYMPGKFRQGA